MAYFDLLNIHENMSATAIVPVPATVIDIFNISVSFYIGYLIVHAYFYI